MTTAAHYAEFAVREAHGVSPAYERLSHSVSRDDEVLALIDTLPPSKRQPNLLFSVVRFLGDPVEDPIAFHDYAVASWPAIDAEIRMRATQTNEAGRCAVLLPVLAALLVRGDLVDDLPAARPVLAGAREASTRAVREAVAELFAPERSTLRLPADQAAGLLLAQLFAPSRWGSSAELDVDQVIDIFLHGAVDLAEPAAN